MAVHLYVAPAGAGKTEACIDWVRAAARGQPLRPVWAVLPNSDQVRAFRRRLAAAGGALGVEVATFHALYHETLQAAGQVYAELEGPLQHRLLRAVVDEAAEEGWLQHYAPLRDKPGFVRALRQLVKELKQARVQPSQLEAALEGSGPRLQELARLYASYQRRLREGQWMDAEGLGWLATLALARTPGLLGGWALVVVDGFDQLDQTQVAFLAELARQLPELYLTLTWCPTAERLAHRRFRQVLERLQAGLRVSAEPLPGAAVRLAAPLARLEAGLFEPDAPATGPTAAITFLEAPGRAAEARAALRWAKERLVGDGLAPGEVAILARDLDPYAPFLAEAADEFGLPLVLAGGRPLVGNPAVAALLGLLSLARRDRSSASLPDGRFPLRQTLEALRSPYFDWRGDPTAVQVDELERVALEAQVLGGLAEWREALASARAARHAEDVEGAVAPLAGEAGTELLACFERFVARVTPPATDTVSGYTAFVEALIGEDPGPQGDGEDDDPRSLRVLARIRSGPDGLVERDLAAMRELKEVLRGLVWADAALGRGERITYERYLDELAGAAAASLYQPAAEAEGALWAASVHDARGLSFRAVALLGLAEGVFPCAPDRDALLPDSDRARLAAQGLPLEPPPPGAEFTLFYEAVTRAREHLLLTRPYLTEDGQRWEPSPFWEEVERLCGGAEALAGHVRRVHSGGPATLSEAASWPEALVVAGRGPAVAALAAEPEVAPLLHAAQHGAAVLAARVAQPAAGPFEGDCAAVAPALAVRYAPERPWSASRLETYLGCPLAFFLAHALELPERPSAQVGFDAAQLGTMAHEILEQVYRLADAADLDGLLAALPEAAARVLADAPRRLGFRPSRLWQEEQARIQADLENTLRALHACSEGWQPVGLELCFGREGAPPQRVVAADGRELLLRGVIDRVDRNAAGQVRVIDYKTSGESIAPADLLEGRRIQLGLYAWAAQGVLGLGTVVAGHYWHVRKARSSSLTLEGIDGGAAGAMTRAAEHALRAATGVRAGAFAPAPAGRRCPPYCRGKDFCWRYEAKQW